MESLASFVRFTGSTQVFVENILCVLHRMAETKQVAVCGGGLVGCLSACFMAKRGYKVEVFEMRPDTRTHEVEHGRSIKMTLSARGREALKAVGLDEAIVEHGVEVYGRMIHDLDGRRRLIPYGKGDQHIISVDRHQLNGLLLDAVEKYSNVTTYFRHKLHKCNFETGEIVLLKDEREKIHRKVDLIVGSDGAYSKVRQQMMKSVRFDFQQEFISHGYIELTIPRNKNGDFAMEANYLHVWPRNEFMMIALPNEDKSYTATLFMPFEMFEAIKTEDQLVNFFRSNFPDSLPLLGEENLKIIFTTMKPFSMVSVKCSPYHVRGKAVLIGDAAHAMVPFYGQGMNCGFEDCLVLSEILDKHEDDLLQALPEYTKYRIPDAKAICDLAMYNYVELRAHVNTKLFLLRKKLDTILNTLFPRTWIPLYTMVTFTRTRYQECVAHRAWQDKVLHTVVATISWTAVTGLVLALWTLRRAA